MPRVPLLIVDGINLAWRAACGFPGRIRSRSGLDITAAFGFFALLRKTHREKCPGAEIVVCFDSESAVNPRRDQFPDYRRGGDRDDRGRAPFQWIPSIFAGLDALSIQWSEAGVYEADDDIATVVRGLSGRPVRVMSSDHDFLQLVDRAVRLITPRRTYAVGDVVERFSIHPRQWCDFRALMGDPSDNVPGIRGVGPKRAAYVLRKHRVLETAHLPNTWWGRRIKQEQEQALRWRDLVRLREDQDVGFELTGRPTRELPLAAQVCEVLRLWS